jgi:hypothetical protein
MALLAVIHPYVVGVFVVFWIHRGDYLKQERWNMAGIAVRRSLASGLLDLVMPAIHSIRLVIYDFEYYLNLYEAVIYNKSA